MPDSVVVYSSTGCPHCQKVKEQLKEWDIPYEEKNVSEHKEYFEELQQRKIFGTPATLINGKIVLGFQREKMKKLLGIEDQPEAAAKDTVQNDSSTAANDSQHNKPKFQAVNQSILDETYDFVAIGGGPAGASAAVYAARGRLKTLVIDKAPTAGTLAITHKIANYPGVRKEQTGLELLAEMQLQAQDFGADFIQTNVLDVDFSNADIKKLHIPEGTIKAKSVFIAVGAKAPAGKIKGEEEFTGRGVSYCSTCDAAFFEGKTVVVAGDNAEAVHEAEALAKFCKEVKLLIPGTVMKGEVDLADLEEKQNVTIYKKHRIKEIDGEHSVERIIIQDDERKEHTWQVDGVFLYLGGMKPGTDFLKQAVEHDEEGYVRVDENLKTNVDGVYAGGDARKTPIKQAVISAADGCIAALGADQHVNQRSKMRPQYS
jgi:thioredoxin reductase (NADPH)